MLRRKYMKLNRQIDNHMRNELEYWKNISGEIKILLHLRSFNGIINVIEGLIWTRKIIKDEI